MAEVLLDGVSKIFRDGTVAVSAVDLTVKDGELLVLVGPSGCGKATLLRMVAGLETETSGRISIGGEVVNGRSPAKRDIAMVFQNYALYPHMTVRRNMELALKLRRMPKPERRRRVEEVAEILGLVDLLERRPSRLSGGQRQRVAMGRAIVRQPAVFLLDEPLSNLDAKLRSQVRAEITELQRRLGTTMIFVTHDQIEAMTMADRVAVLRRGTLQQVGPAQDIYDHPANLFVADFIGSPAMNLIAGRIVLRGDQAVLSVSGSSSHLPLPAIVRDAIGAGGSPGEQPDGARVAVGQPVIFGFRPEGVAIMPGGDGDGMAATVRLVESLGGEALVHVEVEAPPVVTDEILEIADDADEGAPLEFGPRARFVARVPGASPVSVGDRVTIAPKPGSRAHLFDPTTSIAILS